MRIHYFFFICIMVFTSMCLIASDYSYVTTKTLIIIYEEFQDGSAGAEITASDVSTIINPAVAFFREFYWRNSHLKVNLEISWFHIPDVLDYSDLSSSSEYLYFLDPMRIRSDMVANSLDPEEYGSVIAIYALPIEPNWMGLTWPVLIPGGECAFTCIPSSRFSSLRGILVHEYNHALDFLNEFNSLLSYPSNEIIPYINEGNTGPYDCFYELNGGIVRDWPVSQWFNQPNYTWGVIRTTVDADDDGVPDQGSDEDEDPPAITELIIGSSTSDEDTDDDGLSDIDEIMAHYYTSSSLFSADSDSDSIPDAKDPYPIYDAITYCAKASDTPGVTIDGIITANEHHHAKGVIESTHTVYTYLDWDEDNLYVSLQIDSFFGSFTNDSVRIFIDKNGDGIIHGNDNYMIRVGPFGGSLSIKAYTVQVGEWSEPGIEYTTHYITGAMSLGSNFITIELAIPSTSPVGVDLAHGEKFGIQIGYLDNFIGIRQDVLTQRYGEDMEFLDIVLRDNPAGKDFKAQYCSGRNDDPYHQIEPIFNVINTGFETINLSDCKIRYYYTCENPTTQQFYCDYFPWPLNSSMVTGQFVWQGSNNYYLEVGFTTAAGSLAPGEDTGETKCRFNKTDWSMYTQSNDYSFNNSFTSLTDYDKVTIYYKGELAWGTAP